ncbi:hypothetical protein F5Y14DRAFT_288999 [Nemania sp. NC0429]|nr:hypothetical protein F5Y14DRAFT_288999 [Nemania sp. NC0429]
MGFNIHQISSCGRRFFVIDIVFSVLCIFFLGLRFWSARFSRRKLYIDDYAAVAAFVSKSGLTGAQFWGTFNGLGKHITELSLSQLTIQVKILLISEFSYLLGTAFVKLSMLCLYHRIYTTRIFRRWVYFVIALDVIYVISFIPLFLTNCIPLSQYWDPKPTGWCRDTIAGDNATLAVNLVLDLLVLALPLPVLWRLQMSIRDKLTVTAMFGFGFVTIALVIWRLVVTQQTRESPDWTATLCTVGIIASLEIYLGIIAVCIPTLGPLFNEYLKPFLGRFGFMKTHPSASGARKLYEDRVGGSGSNKRSRGYAAYGDSVDKIISHDDSMKLTPMGEGKVTSKVVSESGFKPINETRSMERAGDGIHVQRDIEAIYHSRKGPYHAE